MKTIGETLRRERVRQGLEFQKLSESTKISTRMLQAMEAGDLSKLPGGVFTRSFFKQYGEALGLDPSYIETELLELKPDPEPVFIAPESHFSPSKPGSGSVTAAGMWMVLAFAGCGGVYYLAKNYQSLLPALPAKPAGSSVVHQAPPDPMPKAKAESPVPVEEPKLAGNTTPTLPIGSGSLQVVLNASEASWVSISVDGRQLFSGILQPNDRREINAEEKVKVVAGNAGGLDISLNGKNIEALGPKGQVRTVELTRAGVQVVSRTPKPGPLL